MKKTPAKVTVAIQFVSLIGIILTLSFLSTLVWGGKPEEGPVIQEWTIHENMTIAEFGQANNVPEPVLKKALQLDSEDDLRIKIGDFTLSQTEVCARVDKTLAIYIEQESKNWIKILVKFALWIAFLTVVLVLLHRQSLTPRARIGLYTASVVLFGVVLGSDPSPMGTVKDAIILLGSKGVLFLPRIIALSVFLLMVILANKFICAWGCQFGTLQDLIFRLNRDPKDRKGNVRQFKIPFVLSNSIRVLFFILFTVVAFLWAVDIVDPIDPFKIYKPQYLGIAGGIFLFVLLLLSLFTYRPWCSMFCPFGLVGWLFEKIGLFKIKVNYDTCIACEACAKACPSTVMDAVLKRNRVIPDCFACGTCIEVCPTRSISFAVGKRSKPPEGKFHGDRTGESPPGKA